MRETESALLLTVCEVARLLAVPEDRVRRLIAADKIQTVHLARAMRVPRTEIRRLLNGRSINCLETVNEIARTMSSPFNDSTPE